VNGGAPQLRIARPSRDLQAAARFYTEGLVVAPTDEDLLVFYIPNLPAWEEAMRKLQRVGAREIINANPFWRARGVTFRDPDGCCVVLCNEAFTD
jgi:hypothetical protein